MVEVGEQIIVGTLFRNGFILPRYFVWKGRKFLVDTIPLTYTKTRGRDNVVFFSVCTVGSTSLYEISFNTTSMIWKIERVEEEI